MVLSVLKVEQETETRIGLITSRRVGGAVVRNLVRRRLREVVRALRPQLRPGLQLVLVARAAAGRADFATLRADLLVLAQRSAIFLSACS